MLEKLKQFFFKHWFPLLVAVAVGLISVLPQFLAISALGDSYQGIHFLYIDDEDNYMAMIRDIVNGHWLAGAPEFFEYKAIKPIMLPFGAYLYAVPIMVFGIPIVSVMLMGKVFFPAILFLLVYALVKKLTPVTQKWNQNLVAASTSLLVTVGYELVDYHTTWKFLTGQIDYPLFSLWTRPVNPITGALLLFSFILVLLRLMETRKKYLLFTAGALQASMVYYFFSWGVSLSLSAMFLLIFWVRKEYTNLKNVFYALVISIILLLPYWFIVWNSLGAGMGNDMAARNGMFFTHAPIFNKIILAGLVIFLPFFIKEWFVKQKAGKSLEEWWWVCLAFLTASLWAFNQQIITGRTIWPHHFVQYTVALTMVAVMVFGYNYLQPKFPKAWTVFVISIMVVTLGYGVAISSTYKYRLSDFKELQRYTPLFTWVNTNASKDCVILSTPNAEESITLITALTHCNSYVSGQTFIIPQERIMHNLLVWMRLQNILPEKALDYLYANPHKISTNFQPDWNQLFNPNTTAPWFVAAAEQVNKAYAEFYKQDFATELAKYRLDYVVSSGDLDPGVAQALPGLRFVTKLDKMQVYEFAPEK